jgi:hypothetical protein
VAAFQLVGETARYAPTPLELAPHFNVRRQARDLVLKDLLDVLCVLYGEPVLFFLAAMRRCAIILRCPAKGRLRKSATA